LQKRHNAISYHKCCEECAAGAARVAYEKGAQNCSDGLTKILMVHVSVSLSCAFFINSQIYTRCVFDMFYNDACYMLYLCVAYIKFYDN
jgi:hypothetical protein